MQQNDHSHDENYGSVMPLAEEVADELAEVALRRFFHRLGEHREVGTDEDFQAVSGAIRTALGQIYADRVTKPENK